MRDRLDDRQRLAVEHRTARSRPVDVALEQHLVAVGERRHERARDVRRRARELDPQRRALVGGLDDDREAEPLLDRRQRVGGAELLERGLVEGEEVRRRDAGVEHVVLGEDLVGAADAGRHAEPV